MGGIRGIGGAVSGIRGIRGIGGSGACAVRGGDVSAARCLTTSTSSAAARESE